MRYQLGHFQAVLASTTPPWMQAEIDRRTEHWWRRFQLGIRRLARQRR
jgi:hypothetical protein